MRTSLIIVTYERPAALARALDSVAAQSQAPDEVIIADDGSGPAVAAVVAAFSAHSSTDVKFVRQEHAGFRAVRMRNLAIARCTGDYVLLLDGDMVLHPDFVADHVRAARPGGTPNSSIATVPPGRTTRASSRSVAAGSST